MGRNIHEACFESAPITEDALGLTGQALANSRLYRSHHHIQVRNTGFKMFIVNNGAGHPVQIFPGQSEVITFPDEIDPHDEVDSQLLNYLYERESHYLEEIGSFNHTTAGYHTHDQSRASINLGGAQYSNELTEV